MQRIILFTNVNSLQKHWEDALFGSYNRIHISHEMKLLKYLSQNSSSINILLDELSVTNIQKLLDELKVYSHASVLLFHSSPEVHHASTLIQVNIKGYEHSYLNKINLLQMLESVESGKNWLFAELTNYIINKYIQSSSQNEPEFVKKLTLKEKEIALMLADGLSNKEIAEVKKNALSTVKGHIKHIFEKAGVSDRVSLALMFK